MLNSYFRHCFLFIAFCFCGLMCIRDFIGLFVVIYCVTPIIVGRLANIQLNNCSRGVGNVSPLDCLVDENLCPIVANFCIAKCFKKISVRYHLEIFFKPEITMVFLHILVYETHLISKISFYISKKFIINIQIHIVLIFPNSRDIIFCVSCRICPFLFFSSTNNFVPRNNTLFGHVRFCIP